MKEITRFNTLSLEDIYDINNIVDNSNEEEFLIGVNSTVGLTSELLDLLDDRVRITIYNGFDKTKIKNHSKNEVVEILESLTYSKLELKLIIEEMEVLEKGIKSNWSDYQKLIYFYERIKTSIKFDPKYKEKSNKEVRSLRSILSKQGVCVAYALILKELCNRSNIKCDYVLGKTDDNSKHAWNIVTINGRMYPMDVTWDSLVQRRGLGLGNVFLGQNSELFRKKHIPASYEKVQNYKDELSTLDMRFINSMINEIDKNVSIYDISDFTRTDGTMFSISQIGVTKVYARPIYKYAYFTKDKRGNYIKPIIFYSLTSLKRMIYEYEFGNNVSNESMNRFVNELFSVDNLEDSLEKGTWFIGGLDEEKDEALCERLSFPSKQFKRSDGSCFVIHYIDSKDDINKYEMIEQITLDDIVVIRKNTLYSERDLLSDKRVSFTDSFLSRERIDRKACECGGYLGYFDEHGLKKYSEEVKNRFDTNNSDFNKSVLEEEKDFPSFEEAKSLVEKYYISYDLEKGDSVKIINKKTGKTFKKGIDFYKGLWSNLWLSSAGTKWIKNESVSGITYAFNEALEPLYNYIHNQLRSSCEKNGVIDTIALFNLLRNTSYKYGIDIIVNLFRNEYQTEIINEYFRYLTSTKLEYKKPIVLYNEMNASKLLRDSSNISL